MKRILLVRHAQALGSGGSDPALDSFGEQQAASVARRLADENVTRVLCGPKRRAMQTAHAIALLAERPYEPTSLLDDLTPVPSPDRLSGYPAERREWLEKVPPSERDENAQRLNAAWTSLSELCRADSEAGTFVLVTHAFVVASFVTQVLSAPPAAWLQLPVANTSITEVTLLEGGASLIVGFNDVCHLR